MEQHIFTDGIGRISVIGGVVRVDFVTYSPSEIDEKGQARAILTERAVMGVEAFLRSAEKVAEAAQRLNHPMKPAAAPQPAPAPEKPAANDTVRPQTVPPQFRRESIRPGGAEALPARTLSVEPPRPASPWTAMPKRPFP